MHTTPSFIPRQPPHSNYHAPQRDIRRCPAGNTREQAENLVAAADTPSFATQSWISITGPIPLAPNDVKGFFTLFPKCFSSFVHTTCSLSDLVQYLAFGEVHLRISTALSNCTTLGSPMHTSNQAKRLRDRHTRCYGTITLLGGDFHRASSICSRHAIEPLALQFRGFRFLPPQIQA